MTSTPLRWVGARTCGWPTGVCSWPQRRSAKTASYSANLQLVYDAGSRFERPQLLVARGDRAALVRWDIRAPGSEWSLLAVLRVDDVSRFTDWVTFDLDDRAAAETELDRLTPDELPGDAPAERLAEVDDAGARQIGVDPGPLDAARPARRAEGVPDTMGWRAASRHAAAISSHDWGALVASLAPRFEVIDRRKAVSVPEASDPMRGYRLLFSLDDWSFERTLLATHGERRVLTHDVVWVTDGAVVDAEVESVNVYEVDSAGRLVRHITFDLDDLDAARAELVTMPFDTPAAQVAVRCAEATNAHDWAALEALIAPDVQFHDWRLGVTAPPATDLREVYRSLFEMDDWRVDRTLIEAHGERRVLGHDIVWFRTGEVPAGEVEVLNVFDVDAAGHLARVASFAGDDLDRARTDLHSDRPAARPFGNPAWGAALWLREVTNAQDWDAFVAGLAPGFEYHDLRFGVGLHLAGAAAPEAFRPQFSMRRTNLERTLRATRGPHLALTHDTVTFSDGEVREAEIDCVTITECDDDGRLLRSTCFDTDDQGRAVEELERRHADLESSTPEGALADRDPGRTAGPAVNAAWRAVQALDSASDAGDWTAFSAVLDPTYELVERRTISLAGPSSSVETYELMFGLDEWRMRHDLLGTRGDRLVLVRTSVSFNDGATGPAEVEAITVYEIGPDGRIVREMGFDVDDFDGATAALDRRWVELQGEASDATRTTASRAALRMAARSGELTWDEFVSVLHPEYEFVDLRPGLYIPPCPGSLHNYRTMFALDEWELRRMLIDTRGDQLALVRARMQLRDGVTGLVEIVTIGLVETAPDGRILRETLFEADDLDGATAALDARWAEVQEEQGLPEATLAIPGNLAARSVGQPGWTRLSALGEHVCLHDTGERLVLHEVDHDGEVTAFLAFAREDRRSAFDEVSQRAFTRYGAPEPSRRLLSAMNARDIPGLRACLSDDCVVEDHRRRRVLPIETGDEYAEGFRLYFELVMDFCVEMRRIDAVEPWGIVSLNVFTGTSHDGAAFEIPTLACATWHEDGRANLLAFYEPVDREAAVARLAQAMH